MKIHSSNNVVQRTAQTTLCIVQLKQRCAFPAQTTLCNAQLKQRCALHTSAGRGQGVHNQRPSAPAAWSAAAASGGSLWECEKSNGRCVRGDSRCRQCLSPTERPCGKTPCGKTPVAQRPCGARPSHGGPHLAVAAHLIEDAQPVAAPKTNNQPLSNPPAWHRFGCDVASHGGPSHGGYPMEDAQPRATGGEWRREEWRRE